MDEKLQATLDKIIRLTEQNPEFGKVLRKRLGMASSANSILMEDERINQIYEYCIEKILRQQAKQFYSDFPLNSIKGTLIEDFIRMETFRRKDNFGDFCLSLYQQIECMTNNLCEKKELSEITETLWGYPAYVKTEKGKQSSIADRSGHFTIASLVFPHEDKDTGKSNAFEKSRKPLKDLYAMDRVRTIVYFIGYKATMKNSDYSTYIRITSLLNDIYQCRNMNHRGNTQSQSVQKTLERVMPLKSFYYFKFMGVLAQYIEFIKNGYVDINNILEYCKGITPKEVEF